MKGISQQDDIVPLSFRAGAGLNGGEHRRANTASLRKLYVDKLQFGLRSLFHLAGFLGLNMLAALGAFVLFFIALGTGEPSGFFVQISEVSRRFLQASAERQADFLLVVTVVFMASVILLCALRAVVLRDRLVGGAGR